MLRAENRIERIGEIHDHGKTGLEKAYNILDRDCASLNRTTTQDTWLGIEIDS
jgi:hypothetical protein